MTARDPSARIPSAIERIAAERQRQCDEEKWTPTHDDLHAKDELAIAAACYALPEDFRPRELTDGKAFIFAGEHRFPLSPDMWPWNEAEWKPEPLDRQRELVKAAALLVAEIERLDRVAG